MSLTLLWNGATHFFESHAKARDAVHHNTRLEHRITKHIYVLRAGILGAEPTTPIILKIARDAGEIAALENEASMYQDQLKSLQGKYVPRFYGIYHGDVEGTPVACMLLEYCVEGKYKLSACEMK
jgi:hypothetical protein